MNTLIERILIMERRIARKISLNWLDKIAFRIATGRRLNLRAPRYLNEKLMWLNRYDQNPLKWECADKYRVHSYLKRKQLDQLSVPIIGVWKDVEEIDFTKLPRSFVLKCNHGCGFNIIVKDKDTLNVDSVKSTLNHWLSVKYGGGLERHYLYIQPCIIAEKYLEMPAGNIIDYKLMCINGYPMNFLVCRERDEQHHVKLSSYSLEWARLNVLKNEDSVTIMPPVHLQEMIGVGQKIAKDFPFIRVDFYEVEGRIYIGELTFTPQQNILDYYQDEFLLEMGDKLCLPSKVSIFKGSRRLKQNES